MRKARNVATPVAVLGCCAFALLGGSGGLRAADHRDGPIFAAGRADTRQDVNDVYVFTSPETPSNTVIVFTVSPMAGFMAPRGFAPKTRYEIAIDTNGDAAEDQVYTFVFGNPDPSGRQGFGMLGPGKLRVRGAADGSTVPIGAAGKLAAGLFDDPFYFDFIGSRTGFQFSAAQSRNFFRGLDTMAIVLEVPTASFGPLTNATLGVWARTLKGRRQVDRMGRPGINALLIPAAERDAYNASAPRDDLSAFSAAIAATLKAPPFSRSDADANQLVGLLLPDILPFRTDLPARFPNGRALRDDVIDVELNLLTKGALTTDFVDSDSAFRGTFPYLAPPNQ